jgi:molybdenum cofactor synthesis domain-containing protein
VVGLVNAPKLHLAAVLAVGTEVVSGQIVNGNAAKLSQLLSHAGAEVVLHETVADERAAITEALERCSRVAGLVVVTGGLGPTTDDFTRDVIADWAGLTLEFHEPSWEKIVDRLERRGVAVAPSNRQQCYFPRGAQVLVNPDGTADGFYFKKDATHLWALPGPPNEIDAIWNGGADLGAMVRSALPADRPRLRLFTWDCLGKSEAELGEIVEKALDGSGLQTGYRLHRPYIEVKVWVKDDAMAISEVQPWFARLETAIAPWLGSRTGEDIGANCLHRIMYRIKNTAADVEIYDACTAGLLTERIGALLRRPENRDFAENVTMAIEWKTVLTPEEYIAATLEAAEEGVLTLTLAGITSSGEWAIGMKSGDRMHQEKMKSPYRSPAFIDDRLRSYIVEIALKKWSEWI